MLVGKNGVGKTSILDARAVALGVWLQKVPDSLLAKSRRPLTGDMKRLTATFDGDRVLLRQAPGEMAVRAWGRILDRDGISWGQVWSEGVAKISHRESKQAIDLIWSAYQSIQRENKVLLPIIAYYGAGRTWLPHDQRNRVKARSIGPANRWEAFYDCLNADFRRAKSTDKS